MLVISKKCHHGKTVANKSHLKVPGKLSESANSNSLTIFCSTYRPFKEGNFSPVHLQRVSASAYKKCPLTGGVGLDFRRSLEFGLCSSPLGGNRQLQVHASIRGRSAGSFHQRLVIEPKEVPTCRRVKM